MQSFLNIFKSRYFWIGFGFLLLISLTLVLGAWFDWSLVTRLIVIIGLLVLSIGVVVYEFVRANKSAQQIEESIKAQAEEQRQRSRPDNQAKIQELQEGLEDAIGKLKQSNLGRGRRGSSALYALPWYLMVGPPGAGKTTAIKNSGLNFPIGNSAVKGVGGTRNCDWFFAEEAILLDTAGRYMTEHEDEEEWEAFLDMLKEYREDRPINGVIVGISIEDLLDADPDEIEWHANNIRRRVSELVDRLEVRFPVYLVFTKCDLMQGFVEFFGDMTREEREQIWGCTLTDEQRDADSNLRTVFEHEYDQLYDSLIDARGERLSRSMKREKRRRVYVFPLEFASAKENLSLFVDQLFQRNPYQENPEFRGFYFTSGTQEGAPIDRVIESISDQFDFTSGSEDSVQSDGETKSYFINDLFTDVIIPDQYLVERTFKSEQRGRYLRWGVGAAAVVLLTLFTLGLSQALVRSQLDLSRVESAAESVADIRWDGRNASENLESLNQLRTEFTQLEKYEDDPPFMRWGLYRGDVVLDPARKLYYQKLRPLVRDHFRALEQRLSQRNVSSLTEPERTTLRTELENYLLLSDSSQALSNDRYRGQLSDYLIDQMTQSSPTMATVSFQNSPGEIEQHVTAFVSGLQQNRVDPFKAQTSLVRRVTRAVQRPPTVETIYSRIKRQGQNVVPEVALTDILGRSSEGLTLFEGRPTVSGFFTKQGWENFVKGEIESAAEQPGQGGLIGGSSSDLSEELRNADKLAEQLRERYFGEYAVAWKEFMNNLSYRSYGGGVRTAAENLQILGSEYNSPLLRILARATVETKFESAVDEAKEKLKESAINQAQRRARGATGARGNVVDPSEEAKSAMHPVNRQMRWLHRLQANKAQSGEAARDLVQALEALRKVGTQLDGVRGDQRQAYDYAKQVLSDDGGQLDQNLRALRDALSQFPPPARRNLFEAPILRGWESVLSRAQKHLNERWNEEIYRYYQSNLQGKYPFDPQSDQGAPLRRVQTFFEPQKGIVKTFERDRLRPFLRENENTPKEWQGRGIDISRETTRMLETVDLIGRELFRSGALRLKFELKPELPTTEGDAPSPGEVFIRVHGKSSRYSMGYQPRTEFSWPGSSTGVLLSVQTQEGTLGPKQWDGRWAWFRLLEEAEIDPQNSTKYRVRWRFQHPSGRYSVVARYDLWSEASSKIFTQKPSGFFRIEVPESINP